MCFKPYYKWITLNTAFRASSEFPKSVCFKPYYKWITLNTLIIWAYGVKALSFKPYYKWITLNTESEVRNMGMEVPFGFKPYYKWITLNT